MPVVYGRHASRSTLHTSSSSSAMSLTDADDSIVLSDLLRSGEASRLRRRGAINIRDSAASSPVVPSSATHITRPPMSPTIDRPPLFSVTAPAYPGEFDEEEEEGYEDGGWGFGTAGSAADIDFLERDARRLDLEAEMRIDDADQAAGLFALYCGGNAPPLDAPLSHVHPPRRKPSAFAQRAPPAPPPPRTTGCGALVHVSAVPRRKCGVWIARGDAGPSVAPLERAYFSARVVDKIMESSCGCVRVGVGCRVCGNALGTIFTPCQAAAAGLFSASTSPSPSPGPPEPERAASPPSPSLYWTSPPLRAPAPAPQPAPPPASVYTFFSDAVSPQPGFAFPAPPSPSPPTPTMPSAAPAISIRRRWPALSVQVDVRSSDRTEPADADDAHEDPDGDGSFGRRSPAFVVGELMNLSGAADVDAAEKIETGATAIWAER